MGLGTLQNFRDNVNNICRPISKLLHGNDVSGYESYTNTSRGLQGLFAFTLGAPKHLSYFLNFVSANFGDYVAKLNFSALNPTREFLSEGKDYLTFVELPLRVLRFTDKKLWNSTEKHQYNWWKVASTGTQVVQKLVESCFLIPQAAGIINLAKWTATVGLTPVAVFAFKEGCVVKSSVEGFIHARYEAATMNSKNSKLNTFKVTDIEAKAFEDKIERYAGKIQSAFSKPQLLNEKEVDILVKKCARAWILLQTKQDLKFSALKDDSYVIKTQPLPERVVCHLKEIINKQTEVHKNSDFSSAADAIVDYKKHNLGVKTTLNSWAQRFELAKIFVASMSILVVLTQTFAYLAAYSLAIGSVQWIALFVVSSTGLARTFHRAFGTELRPQNFLLNIAAPVKIEKPLETKA